MKIINKKAKFNYKLETDRYEAGIVLKGNEIKAARNNKVDISNAHARILENEAWLINLHVSGAEKPTRTRKLLLNKNEIVSIGSKMKQRKLTLVPTVLYTKGQLVKVKLALGKTKKKYEKRETLKKKDIKRQIEKEIKN